jgi:DNA-binding transcriptional ArsR family regulator
MQETHPDNEIIPILPEDVPVLMPELPFKLLINNVEQLKACGDPIRERILFIIQQQPATAKQIADRLKASPGAIGHHLHVLEAAGLAKVVARRFVRGTVANYYTRTARLFIFDLPKEIVGNVSMGQRHVTQVSEELAEAIENVSDDLLRSDALLHPRLSPERAKLYRDRLEALMEDILHEIPDPEGEVYSFYFTTFKSPDYLQVQKPSTPSDSQESE